MRALTIIIASAVIALVVALAILRLAYPYEVEWMEGAMLDHVVRILAGQPIYSAPTIDFVPWLYPPLYYYVVAIGAKIFGMGFFAGRLVSFLSTLVTAAALAWMVLRATQDRILAYLTLALYLGTYATTGFYFDIVRNDSFFTMLLVFAVVGAIGLRGTWAAFTTGIILSLAFLTKQQAMFFLPPLALYFWFRNKKECFAFVSTAFVLSLIVLLLLDHSTHGWSTYYMFTIPHAKQANFSFLRMFDVFPDYALGTFATCSVAMTILPLLNRNNRSETWFLLWMMALAALVAGAVSLGNEGGYKNVMMPFAAFAVPIIPIAVHEIRARWLPLSRYALLPIVFQFAAFYFNPLSETMVVASAHQRAGGDAFMAKLRAMAGEVYIPYHGYIGRMAGKDSHAHILATLDVLRVHDTTAQRLQSDWDTAYARHRFSAVIMEECQMIPPDSVNHYTFAGRMIAEPNVMLTRFASIATRPEFVFLPK